jgi:uroporphyrinogen III methyltransferase / synthase
MNDDSMAGGSQGATQSDRRPSGVRARPGGPPLAGRRVLVTRPEGQNAGLAGRLRELGAEPLVCPTVRIAPPEDTAPLDAAIARLAGYDWAIFTSANGVRFFWERLAAAGGNAEALAALRLGAIGPATAAALAGHGLHVDFVPERYVAEGIVEGIGDVAGQRILLPRADIARRALVDGLREKGALVDEVVAYHTTAAGDGEGTWLLPDGERIDIATFTSPSTVRNFVALLGEGPSAEALAGTTIACIGPITAAAAEDLGLHADIVAAEHTVDGLIDAIIAHEEGHGRW